MPPAHGDEHEGQPCAREDGERQAVGELAALPAPLVGLLVELAACGRPAVPAVVRVELRVGADALLVAVVGDGNRADDDGGQESRDSEPDHVRRGYERRRRAPRAQQLILPRERANMPCMPKVERDRLLTRIAELQAALLDMHSTDLRAIVREAISDCEQKLALAELERPLAARVGELVEQTG